MNRAVVSSNTVPVTTDINRKYADATQIVVDTVEPSGPVVIADDTEMVIGSKKLSKSESET